MELRGGGPVISDAQLRKEQRDAREFSVEEGTGLIQSEAIKRGLAALSQERVEDTLLAEAGDLAPMVEKFRDSRAEHNDDSLAEVLGIPQDEARQEARLLVELGFLEVIGETHKIPMLYRQGLGITQGKAFAPDEDPHEED